VVAIVWYDLGERIEKTTSNDGDGGKVGGASYKIGRSHRAVEGAELCPEEIGKAVGYAWKWSEPSPMTLVLLLLALCLINCNRSR
jgi:hypothetical protein